ncbi:MAG: prepilin peptidase [Mycobacterium sp.]
MAAVAAIGVLGALVGSFLNVVIHRLPLRESIVRPRSHCPGCGRQLAAYENVPVLSWLALRGRCRSCGIPISARYPLVEALTAVAFAVTAAVLGLDSDLAWALPFAAMLICVGAIDLDHRLVPNKIVLPAAVYGVVTGVALRLDELPELVIAAAAGFALLLAVALARPGGMGMGDVKLTGVMGLYLGLSLAPALLVAFLMGSLVGVGVMVRGGIEKRKSAVPFAPFLALGGFAGLLAGPELVDLYANAFLR